MRPRDRPFAAGARTRKAATLFPLDGRYRAAIPGPWTVRAVVEPRRPHDVKSADSPVTTRRLRPA